MLKDLADPRSADGLNTYLNQNPPPAPHWRHEAAMRLAEVGDLRAVPTLAWKLKQDPLKIYTTPDDQEYIQGDGERTMAGRILGGSRGDAPGGEGHLP